MHDTTLPLGKYAQDPRFRIVKVESRDAIRTDRVTIIQGDSGFQVWELDNPGALYPVHTDRSLTRALAYDLGDPCKVGPTGITDWLHTDGRTYKHNPATTGMIEASTLRPGDIVDFPHIDTFTILGPSEVAYDDLGRASMGYPVRRLQGRAADWFSYRSGDMIPVRFAR